MGLVSLAHNAGTGQVAAGQVLMYGQTSAYVCMNGCLYMHGRVLILHGRVPGRYLPGGARYHLIHAKFSGLDLFADRLPLHISNSNCINAIKSAPTGPSCTRTGIVYTLSFTSDGWFLPVFHDFFDGIH